MSTDPLLSVVVPSYNAAQYLRPCLDSIFAQRVSGLEVILVDDGSTDGTRSIAACYGDRLRYLSQPNSGGTSAPRNRGAKAARGRYLTFFDADDIMCAGKLASQLEVLETQPAVGCVLTDYRDFSAETGPDPVSHFETCAELCRETALYQGNELVTLAPDEATSALIRENFSIADSPVFRREVFVEAGGFDEDLRSSEDFDLIYRVARAVPLALLARVGFLRRRHQGNKSNQTLRICDYKIRSRTKLLEQEARKVNRGLLRRALARLYLQRAYARALRGLPGAARDWVRALAYCPAPTVIHLRVLVKLAGLGRLRPRRGEVVPETTLPEGEQRGAHGGISSTKVFI